MTPKKYKLTEETLQHNGYTLYRIQALRDFSNVEKGELGGWIASEKNLSHSGNTWIYYEAKAYEDASVSQDAILCGQAELFGNATMRGNAFMRHKAKAGDFALITESVHVADSAFVGGNATIFGSSLITGNAFIAGDIVLTQNLKICENAHITSEGDVISFSGFGSVGRTTTAYRTKDSFRIICGCFAGSVIEFREAVLKTHGDSKLGKEYMLISCLLESHFNNKT